MLRSSAAARECFAFLTARNVPARILDYDRPKSRPGAEVHVVFYPSDSSLVPREFLQHTGFGIYTRLTDYYISLLDVSGEESIFENSKNSPSVSRDFGTSEELTAAATKAKLAVRERLAELTGADLESVWLYSSGTNALWCARQVCMAALGERKCVCFGSVTFLTLPKTVS